MLLGALPGLGALTLALTASAPPVSSAPSPAPSRPVVSRAPAHTVPAAIARAERLGAISAGRARQYQVQWHHDFQAARRLHGPRRTLVDQSLQSTRRLAAAGRLRSGRLAAALAGVHASVQLAASGRPLPAPAGRVRVPGDSAVYSYRPPHGLQVHPLATIGKLNALAATCT